MEVDITKGLLSDGSPFYEKSNIEFICHAYTTMHPVSYTHLTLPTTVIV